VNTKIGVTHGDLKTEIAPGKMEFINPLGNKVKGAFLIKFYYEVPNEKKAEWKFMTSFKMASYKSRREICIFFYNKQINNVDFRGVSFTTPPTRTPPKPK
jgi:hypothetical protein